MVLLSLDNLSTELLLKIFKYLEIRDLCKLRQTCRRFNDIIEMWGHSFIKNVRLLVTNQVHPIIVDRSLRLLSPFERLRISHNWKCGIYSEKSLLYAKSRFIPWLQLEKDLIWVSRNGHIKAYKRTSTSIDTSRIICTLKGQTRADVCRFIKKDNYILSGLMDGSMWMWCTDSKRLVFDYKDCHTRDINCVDMSNEILVSGSGDNYVKIWRKPTYKMPKHEMLFQSFDLADRVWSVALCHENSSTLAVGTAGISSLSAVTVFDVNKGIPVKRFNPERFGAGVLGLQWDSESTLWSCGYDTHLRLWDLRTGSCVRSFEDPCDSVLYCLQYDYCNSIVCGTQTNGRVVLWDTRQENYVQMYFMEPCRQKQNSSPVYGLSYDAEFLFTVTDQHLNVLDFSVFSGKFRDYSNLFLKLIKA